MRQTKSESKIYLGSNVRGVWVVVGKVIICFEFISMFLNIFHILNYEYHHLIPVFFNYKLNIVNSQHAPQCNGDFSMKKVQRVLSIQAYSTHKDILYSCFCKFFSKIDV